MKQFFWAMLALVPLLCVPYSCTNEKEILDSAYEPPQDDSEDPGSGPGEGPEDEFDKVTGNVAGSYLTGYSGDSEGAVSAREALDRYVTNYMASITDVGAFPDIDYDDRSQTNWKPMEHLNRVGHMCSAYVLPESTHYKDEKLYGYISKALWYWYLKWPTSSNWWYNQIAAPRDLAKPLILMRESGTGLDAEIESALLAKWEETGGDPSSQTGANKTDVALQWLYRGCLQKDAEVVEYALEQAFEPLVYTAGEGIQHDNSYFQHNAQLYIGGYAVSLLNAVVKVAAFVSGTEYMDVMTREQKSVLSSFVTGTLAGCIRGSYMYWNIMGRSVSRAGELDNVSTVISLIEDIMEFDTENTGLYTSALDILSNGERLMFSSLTPSLVHYYIGDFTVYSAPDYSACLRMVSNRTYRSEHLNGENLKGYWISDGSLSVNVQGDEYYDIFPVWDWCKVPGVTAPQTDEVPMNSNYTHVGQSGFTGGVTDGQTGISAYEMRNTKDGVNIYANKSWFFVGDAIVCIGTGIETTMSEEVVTSVNQCLKSGPVSYEIGNSGTFTSLGSGSYTGDITRVWHDKIGYVIDPGNEVTVDVRTAVSGEWSDINTTQSGTVTKDVFTLSLSHGTGPDKGTYSYFMFPGISESEFSALDLSKIRIVAKEETLHAVRNDLNGCLYIAFFKKGTVEADGVSVSADEPCLVVLDDEGKMSISSPYYKEPSSVTVTVEKDGQAKEISVVFSGDGLHKGITHTVNL